MDVNATPAAAVIAAPTGSRTPATPSIVNRLVWAILVLAFALGGKDVLQAVL